MSWSNSKVFAKTVLDAFGNTIAFDLDADSFKAALYNDTITPSNTVTTQVLTGYNGAASQWVTAGEVSETTEWPAGGRPLVTPTWLQSSATVTFDAVDTASAGATADLASVYGTLVYDDTLTNKPGISYNYLGGSNSVVNGTFTIVWSASGICAIVC
jgi:hypothetical protein